MEGAKCNLVARFGFCRRKPDNIKKFPPLFQPMSQMISSFRTATPSELAEALQDARDYTLTLFESLATAGLDHPEKVPRLPYINPPLWELGHIAWFAEWYILREADSSNPAAAQRTSLLTKGDDWFDSNTVPHKSRWGLGLPSTGALKDRKSVV